MAKSKVEAGLAVQEPPKGGLVNYDYGQMAGVGFENQTNDDVSIPFLTVLQALSPQVNGETALEDAKVGMLYNTVTQELFSGKDGVTIVPCDTQHLFVEWVPRDKGGGFVAVHACESEVVRKAKAQATDFGKYRTENGNDLIETFYVYALLLDSPDAVEPLGPIVLAFTSTKIKVYKRFNTQLRTVKGAPPLFAFKLSVKTKAEKNNKGTFSNFDIQPVGGGATASLIPPRLGDHPHPLLLAGEALMKAVRSGLARAAHESQDVAGGDPEVDAPTDKVF